VDQDDLEKLWAITIPVEALETQDPGATFKPLLESAGTVFVPPPSAPGLGSSTADLASLFPGVSAHVSLVRGESSPEELARSAGYELREVIGQGGMGVVYRAHQASLQRDVAIKTIKERGKGEPKFVSEARATGKLDHPNIVPVYDLGATDEGETILAMKLVEGASWKEVLHPTTDEGKERAARYQLEDHLEVLVQVANAVSFAHSRDLVHCDLKPENVMLGDYGEVLVMDWGLAVDVSDEPEEGSTLVHRSQIKGPSGTPSYMPPELAAGEGDKISPRTDVYLLGAILVELLTGNPPHRGKKLTAVIYQAYLSRPPELPEVPEELREIARRALHRDPEERYPSAAEFRDAVRGFLKHRESLLISEAAQKRLERAQSATTSDAAYEDFSAAIAGFEHARVLWEENPAALEGLSGARLAYAESALEHEDLRLAEAQLAQLPRGADGGALRARVSEAKAKRERDASQAALTRMLLGAALVAIFLGLAIGFALVSAARNEAVENAKRAEVSAAEARVESERAEAERARAEEAQGQAERELASALIAQGTMLMTRERYARARQTFLRAEELSARTGQPTLAARIGRWEAERYAPDPLLRFPAPAAVTATAADDERVWVGCEDGTLLEYDLLHQTELSRRVLPGGAVRALTAWRGSLLAGSADGTLHQVDGDGERSVPGAHASAITQLATYEVTRDDYAVHVLSSGEDARINAWTLGDLAPVSSLEHPGGPAPDLSVYRGGGYTGSSDGWLRQWQFWTGNLWSEVPSQITGMRSINAVAHSRWQPVDDRKPSVEVLATATGSRVTLWTFNEGPRRWEPAKQLTGHRAPVDDLLWSHDGEHLLSLSSDGEVRVWTRDGEQIHLLDGVHGGPLVLTPRGFWLITRGEREAMAWDLGLAHREPSGARLSGTAAQTLAVPTPPVLPGEPKPVPPPVTAVALDPSGTWIAGGTREGSVVLYDAASGRPIDDALRGHRGAVRGLHFAAPDAGGVPLLRSCGEDGLVREWKLTDTSGLPVATWRSGLERVSAVAWTADGALLGDPDGRLLRLRERAGEDPEVSELPAASSAVRALAVVGDVVAVGCEDGAVRVGGISIAHAEAISALALDARASRLLVGDASGGIELYALPGGERLGSLEAHGAEIRALAFLGESGALSVGEDGRACSWSLETLRESYLSPPGGPLTDIALSTDPLRVSAGGERGVLFWDLELHPEAQVEGRVEQGERLVRRGSLRAGVTLLEEARAAGEQVSPLVLARAYWGLDYPIAARRVLLEVPEAERSVAQRIVLRAVEVAVAAGSVLGYSDGRTRVLAPLEGPHMLSAGEHGEYQVWNLDTGARLRTWQLPRRQNLYQVSVSPDHQRIAGVDAWSEVRVWDRSGTLRRQFKQKDARRVLLLEEGLLVVTYSGVLRLADDGSVLHEYDLGLDEGERLASYALASPGADRFAIARKSGEVRVFRSSSGELLHSWQAPEADAPDRMRFSPDGERLLVRRNQHLELLAVDGTLLQEIPQGQRPNFAACFDPSGKRLGLVDDYGFVQIYDLERRESRFDTQGSIYYTMSLGFSGDGERLCVGDVHGEIRVYPVSRGE